MISRKIGNLKARRRYWEKKLLSVTPAMAPMSVTRSYHTCGNPKCKRCREEGGRHGPFLYTTWKDVEGKTQSFYVNVGSQHLVDQAHEAWNEFREIGRKIGEINREILRLKIKGSGKDDRKD